MGGGGGGLTTTRISQFNASSFITHPCAGLLVSVPFPGIYLQLCTKENIHYPKRLLGLSNHLYGQFHSRLYYL